MSGFELGQRVTFTHPLSRIVTSGQRNVNGYMRQATLKVWQSVRAYAPAEGVIVGKRTLANGQRTWEDYGHEFIADEHFTAYLIAFDLRRKPVYVRPEHVEALS